MDTIKKGYLYKRSDYRKSWRPRFFVLRSDGVLEYYTDPTASIRGLLYLHAGTRVTRLSENKHGMCTFSLQSGKTYLLATETEAEVSQWVQAIQSVTCAPRDETPSSMTERSAVQPLQPLPQRVYMDHAVHDLLALPFAALMDAAQSSHGWTLVARHPARIATTHTPHASLALASYTTSASGSTVFAAISTPAALALWDSSLAADPTAIEPRIDLDNDTFIDSLRLPFHTGSKDAIRYGFTGHLGPRRVWGVVWRSIDDAQAFGGVLIEQTLQRTLVYHLESLTEQVSWKHALAQWIAPHPPLLHAPALGLLAEHWEAGAALLEDDAVLNTNDTLFTPDELTDGTRVPFAVDTAIGVPHLALTVSGHVQYTNKSVIAAQRGVAKDVLKSLGSNLVKGKSLLALSLPIRIFSPETFLMRLGNVWGFAPLYLGKAARSFSVVEQLKLCIAFVLAGLHCTIDQTKPFNAHLGETFQATFSDGTLALAEQVSKHPQRSAFLIESPAGYRYHGCHELAATIGVNSATGCQMGPNIVELPNGARVTWELSQLEVAGVVWGDRLVHFERPIMFALQSPQEQLQCTVRFGPVSSQGWLSAKRSMDAVSGVILDAQGETRGRLSGSWTRSIAFDGTVYWDAERHRPYRLLTPTSLLPSDSRLRVDRKALADGDLDLAQQLKIELEDEEKRLRKLRQHK